MRNKLPCTAQILSQLQPDMIQSVVGAQIFQLGKEYQAANCVQIIEADDDQILSEVTGPFGMYEQTIQLKGGHLLTKCSCKSNEQPFCRHCVAVLLGYHQPGVVRDSDQLSEIPVSLETVTAEELSPAPMSVNLHHMTIFIDWLQKAIRMLDRGQPLPEAPMLEPGDAIAWIRGIRNLEARWRVSEEKRAGAEAELIKREAQLDRLMQELEVLPHDAQEAQGACADMQNTIANARAMLSKLCDMAKEQEQLESQLTSATEDLLKKGAALSSRFASLKDAAAVIQNIGSSSLR